MRAADIRQVERASRGSAAPRWASRGALFVVGWLAGAVAWASPPLVLTGARLIDGRGGAPIENATVLIRNGWVEAVGPGADLAAPAGAAVRDLHGATLLPGLIDSHVHVTSLLDHPGRLEAWPASGVTTVIDLGSPLAPRELSRRLAGMDNPPRVLAAGPIFTAPGGYPFVGPRSSALEVGGAQEAARRAAELLDGGEVALLKAAVERGFDRDLGDEGWPVPSAETLAALVGEAHRRGLPAVAHVTQPGELEAALAAGFDAVAHTPFEPLPDELLRHAAERGLIMVSTLGLWAGTSHLAGAEENLRRYARLGGRVALGTDAPAFGEPGLPLNELARLVEAGFSPLEAITAATVNAAAVARRDGELGVVAPGAIADLLVVDGDPSADLAALTAVRLVVQAGEILPGSLSSPGRPPG
jgi:imidazolonepropionase-like amidohydrolase